MEELMSDMNEQIRLAEERLNELQVTMEQIRLAEGRFNDLQLIIKNIRNLKDMVDCLYYK